MSYPTSRYNTLKLLIQGCERKILEHRSRHHLRHTMLQNWTETNNRLLAEKAVFEKEVEDLLITHPEYFV